MGNRFEWVHDFLVAGGYPTTVDNMRACLAWTRSEFGGASPTPAAFNLFATTQGAPGASEYNSVGVRNYPDWWTGVHANASTLAENQAGYQSIRDHLLAGQDASATCAAISASVWGSHPNDAILAEVDNDPANNAQLFVGDRPGDAQPGTPTPTPTPTVEDDDVAYIKLEGDDSGEIDVTNWQTRRHVGAKEWALVEFLSHGTTPVLPLDQETWDSIPVVK